jgi:Protein of unknown function (DUF3375)
MLRLARQVNASPGIRARRPHRRAGREEGGAEVSEILGELARVSGAFEQPTLSLLHQNQARFVIAVFRSCFDRDTPAISTARLHTLVEAHMEELRASGERDVPAGSGRDLCYRWMRGLWLNRDVVDGTEVYTLTSHAQDALSLVSRLTRERAVLSEHRIATIINAFRRFNAQANPSRDARTAILNAEIARLADERDRLLAGGEMRQLAPEDMLDGFTEVLSLVSALPSDFARVQEAYTKLRAQILNSFRAEDRTAGQVIDEYLLQVDNLVTATPEGRAFEGAFALLRDEEQLLQLREHIQALLGHPFAGEILLDSDRRELLGTLSVIRRGMDGVLSQRNRVSATLREYIETHNVAHDRELDATLRELDGQLAAWMLTAGPRTTVPVALLPDRVEVEHLRERFHNPDEHLSPPPLLDVSAHRPEEMSLQELLAQGGPSLGALAEAIATALERPTPPESLGELFAELEASLRRPVEILGLLHLAANTDALHVDSERVEVFSSVRGDGTCRDLLVPRVTAAELTDRLQEEESSR